MNLTSKQMGLGTTEFHTIQVTQGMFFLIKLYGVMYMYVHIVSVQCTESKGMS